MPHNFLMNLGYMMVQFAVWPPVLFLNKGCKDFMKGPQLCRLISKMLANFGT